VKPNLKTGNVFKLQFKKGKKKGGRGRGGGYLLRRSKHRGEGEKKSFRGSLPKGDTEISAVGERKRGGFL